MGDFTEGVRLTSKHQRLTIGLSLLVSLITIGHEMCLFFLHFHVVYEVLPHPSWSDVVYHAIPSYLPVACFLCSCLVLICCLTAYLTIDGVTGLLLGLHTFVSVLLSITYPIQISVYLWTHANLYLQERVTHPGVIHPTCCCLPLNFYSKFIENLSYLCNCQVKEDHNRFYIVETPPAGNGSWRDMMASTDPFLQEATFHSSVGNPLCGVGGTQWKEDADINIITMMFIGLEACILVMLLRMPLFMLWNSVEFYTTPGRKETFTLEKKIRGRRSSSVGVQSSDAPGEAETSEKDVTTIITNKEEGRKKSNSGLTNLMPLALAIFLDGCDGFSLLELFKHQPAFYHYNPSSKNLILAFITINIFMLNFANLAATFPKRYRTRINTWRLLVVLSGNVPFLFVRCISLSFTRGRERLDFGNIYTLFMTKEVTLIVMSLTDFVMRICHGYPHQKKREKELDKDSRLDQFNFAQAALDLSASLSFNRSSKYLVQREKQRRDPPEKLNDTITGNPSKTMDIDIERRKDKGPSMTKAFVVEHGESDLGGRTSPEDEFVFQE